MGYVQGEEVSIMSKSVKLKVWRFLSDHPDSVAREII